MLADDRPRDLGAAENGGDPDLIPAGDEHSSAFVDEPHELVAIGVVAIANEDDIGRRRAKLKEDALIALASIVDRRRRRYDRDARVVATGELDKPAQDLPVPELILGAADRQQRSEIRLTQLHSSPLI